MYHLLVVEVWPKWQVFVRLVSDIEAFAAAAAVAAAAAAAAAETAASVCVAASLLLVLAEVVALACCSIRCCRQMLKTARLWFKGSLLGLLMSTVFAFLSLFPLADLYVLAPKCLVCTITYTIN